MRRTLTGSGTTQVHYRHGRNEKKKLRPRCLASWESSQPRNPDDYADKYECPQVFCFDGKTLLLQIHANTPGEIRAENSVDLGPSSSQQHAPSSQDVSSRSHQGGQCSRKQGSDVGNFFKKVEKNLVDKAISPSR
ncbi:hypothetical protein G6O67_007708 [Ophiocordyceps sinensis]|uniref:Uncharacterized protein n=1 Tax=Ophiocordyceps sinensis TaxID=72228 RepID=A0A8H4PP06_9HYPO|nr:hypothetical protein G6O67_007708 [Ophiocordyceps sinensis]